MKFTADCAPCLLRRVLFQSRISGDGLEFEAVRAASEVLGELMDPDRDSVKVATAVHRAAYDAIRRDDPYSELKVKADAVAEPYERELRRLVSESADPLRTAVVGAAAGNIMDFGIGDAIDDPGAFSSVYDGIVAEGLGCDDIDAFKEILEKVPGVVYMFDNCGESRLDKVLIEVLRGMGKRVVGVVRGAPILNDVAAEDAARVGLDAAVDRLLDTGKFQVGMDWDDVPPELEMEIRECGLIVSKGMANFEAASGRDLPVPVVHILRTKCAPVAAALGVRQNVNVVKLILPAGDAR